MHFYIPVEGIREGYMNLTRNFVHGQEKIEFRLSSKIIPENKGHHDNPVKNFEGGGGNYERDIPNFLSPAIIQNHLK